MNKKLFIFTLATSVYNNYIDEQINTINNLFPNIEEKYYIIITDNKTLYNKVEILEKTNLKDIYIYEIINMISDLILVNKYNYIYETLKKSQFLYDDNDIFLFVDADSKFLEKNNLFWKYLYFKILKYDFFLTKYPLCFFNNEYEQASNTLEDSKYVGYFNLTTNVKLIQTSLFGGKIKMIENIYNDLYLGMLKDDLQKDIKNRHIPLLHEESYMMKLVNENINNYNICIDFFSTIIFCPDYKKEPYNLTDDDMITFFPNSFVLQKYNWDIKKNIRQKLN